MSGDVMWIVEMTMLKPKLSERPDESVAASVKL
jgi:hypothetical protein